MNRKKGIFYGIFGIVFIGCFVGYALLSKEKKFDNIVYQIEYPSDTLFTEQEFSNYIAKHCSTVIGKTFDSISLSAFERKVEQFPFISDANVINNQGTLLIKAVQEKIIAKLFNEQNEVFYLAQSGKLVPETKSNPGRVIIANGFIKNKYNANYFVNTKDILVNKNGRRQYSSLYTIWKIVCFINQDPFWQAQIGQIYVNSKQEIELVPTIGEHVVLFGNILESEFADAVIEERFNNLKTVYREGFKITGWNRYSLINLKYGTEIPCEKK